MEVGADDGIQVGIRDGLAVGTEDGLRLMGNGGRLEGRLVG